MELTPEVMLAIKQAMEPMAAQIVAEELAKIKNRQAYMAAYAKESQPVRYGRIPPQSEAGRGKQMVPNEPAVNRTIQDEQSKEYLPLDPGFPDLDAMMSSNRVMTRARQIMQAALHAGKAADVADWSDCVRQAYRETFQGAKPQPAKYAKAVDDPSLKRFQKIKDREAKIRGPHSPEVHRKAREYGESEIAAGRRVSYDACLAKAIGL